VHSKCCSVIEVGYSLATKGLANEPSYKMSSKEAFLSFPLALSGAFLATVLWLVFVLFIMILMLYLMLCFDTYCMTIWKEPHFRKMNERWGLSLSL
jgi:hypothetical protein